LKRARGFTLVEVMVVVAVIAILASIALPSYNSYLRKARRADAQAALTDIASRQQQYLMDARAYAPDLATLNYTLQDSVTKWYTVAIAVAGPPPSFTVTAAPIAGSDQTKDGSLELTSTGAKKRTLSGVDHPW
jgi:type IV pilus assembly protein PilE